MERFFLIVAITTLTSCQFANVIPADKYTEPEPITVTEKEIIYQDVWERIAENSSIGNEELDDITLQYINRYLETKI